MTEKTILRAMEMLDVAARYIRKYSDDEIIHYDDADCDGWCVADDCYAAREDLMRLLPTPA